MLSVDVERRTGAFETRVQFRTDARVTALFGRSGAGKTSLVNMMAGLVRPDRGRIEIDGQVLFDSAAGIDVPVHARRIGYVFQEARLFRTTACDAIFSTATISYPPRSAM